MWIRSGHPACPTDGKPVIGKRKNKPHSKEHVQPSGPNTMLPGWNTGNELMFTVSGRGLEAARQLPVAQVCVQVASRSHAGTIPLASLCPDGVVGEGEATLSTIGKSCIRDSEQDRLPRLHGVARGRLTSCSTISSPKASDSHKRWSRRELLESRRRLLEQRHHHQPAEACILGKSRMQGELPQCCGHSICRNPSPPPAICWNPGPPPAICQNPGPPPAICQNPGPPPAICRNPGPPPAICRNPGPPPAICRNPGPPPAICRNPGPPPAICRNPPTPHTLLHGLRLRKLTKARVRQCTADTSYPNLDVSLHTTAYKTQPCTLVTPTSAHS